MTSIECEHDNEHSECEEKHHKEKSCINFFQALFGLCRFSAVVISARFRADVMPSWLTENGWKMPKEENRAVESEMYDLCFDMAHFFSPVIFLKTFC